MGKNKKKQNNKSHKPYHDDAHPKFGNNKAPVVDSRTGHEFKGYPYAKPLGEIYTKIKTGINELQAHDLVNELIKIWEDEQTHHSHPETQKQIKELYELIHITDFLPLPEKTPRIEEPEPAQPEHPSIGDILIVTSIEKPHKIGGDYSFVPLEGHRVFIKGSVTEDGKERPIRDGDKVKIVSSRDGRFYTGIPVFSGDNISKDPAYFSELKRIKNASKSLSQMIKAYDKIITKDFQEKLKKTGKSIDHLLFKIFGSINYLLSVRDNLSSELQKAEQGQKYLRLCKEAENRFNEAKPMIEAYETWTVKKLSSPKQTLDDSVKKAYEDKRIGPIDMA